MEQKRTETGRGEKIFKLILYAGDRLKKFLKHVERVCLVLFSIISILFILMFIYYIGFVHSDNNIRIMAQAFRIILLTMFILRLVMGLLSLKWNKIMPLFSRMLVLLFAFLVIISNSDPVKIESGLKAAFHGNGMVITACFTLGLVEISKLFKVISSVNFPPSLIFTSSFLLIILIGSALLMLPNSRTVPISYLDALFTAASAVCVTGLTVVNTSATFTDMGKIIILLLIQMGGLGMMTFTGFFSYIFTTQSSLHERMLLQDLFSGESLGNLFKILIKIVFFTFFVEAAGALILYLSLGDEVHNRSFIAVFHSVSAFCNAGFSTFSNGLLSPVTYRNFNFLSAITFLIIIGGLGFPVIIRLYAVVKNKIMGLWRNISNKRLYARRERLDASSRIVITTTLILITAGLLIFFIVERKVSMQGVPLTEQLFLSYFNSVTARTAGFNMSNLLLIGYPAIFLLIFLMWIGASPGSTGGGIKTSTIAIAVLSAWSNIRGRRNLEIARRDINSGVIIRIMSIITLSILVIGTGFFILLISDPGKNPVHLLFEAVSAYSTTGLSLADTSTISQTGKVVLMILMFTGRVGPLTLLTGLFVSGRKKYYKYPGGDIAIN